MKEKKQKNFLVIVYSILITLFAIFVLLDTFLIPKKYAKVPKVTTTIQSPKNIIITENSYIDENISIQISYDRFYDTNLYIADIKIKDISLLKSAFAGDTYGRNILQPTSLISDLHDGILAINGDYYGYRDDGFVIRNGIFYRDLARPEELSEDLIIYTDGSIKIIDEHTTSVQKEISNAQKNNKEIWHIFSFGPAIIKNNKIQESTKDRDVSKNPRTALGIIEPLHYIFICCDGRQEHSEGLTSTELAEYMLSLNCETAYNMDGGGSSTFYFNGKILNTPSNGDERPVSDIVYIGY